MRRLLLMVLAVLAVFVAFAPRASALSASSWNYWCHSGARWVRVNWPTIYTDSSQLQSVWFRAGLYRYTRGRWRHVRHTTRWYVGVSNRNGRYQLDSSLGVLPYPFVGELGHLFAYLSGHGSYAGPQLGPWWGGLPRGRYRVHEQYWVGGTTWFNRHRGTYCRV